MTGMAVLLLVRPIVRHRDRFAQSDEGAERGRSGFGQNAISDYNDAMQTEAPT